MSHAPDIDAALGSRERVTEGARALSLPLDAPSRPWAADVERCGRAGRGRPVHGGEDLPAGRG